MGVCKGEGQEVGGNEEFSPQEYLFLDGGQDDVLPGRIEFDM